ncbi:Alpha/Beta hydrolase protein [Russula aff. rugulosa BPL654]|nr:Alpha/Beta hydrolase protein [Russula aff. rugulosa BPL654]
MVFIAVLSIFIIQVWSQTITVNTTSGRLLGTQADGVASFKGIRFVHPPVGDLRWEPPVAFVSSDTQNATSIGPSCVQQFLFKGKLHRGTINTPAPAENEDCLYLNVWAPASKSGPLKPVVVWIYGGGFEFGSSSLPVYDGTSFAKNQDVVFVSFNYRTNVFGFPTAQEISAPNNNLGLLDQELALTWVQDNIAQFGGDKTMVTIMVRPICRGWSVSLAISRREPGVATPFRAGIMLSGARVSTLPALNFTIFDAFATAMGCGQAPGPQRLQCLRNVSASTIRAYTNGPDSGLFTQGIDNITAFDDPLQRIRTGQTARVPILLGSMEDDGSAFTYNLSNISTFLERFGSLASFVTPDDVRGLYPGLTDTQVIADAERDIVFHCPAKLWSDAFVSSGIRSVYRYTYGAMFADLQPFPDLGVWHGSELPILFGTFNKSTASPAEVELSKSFQTAFANFVKNPNSSRRLIGPRTNPRSRGMPVHVLPPLLRLRMMEMWTVKTLSKLFFPIPRMDRAVYGTNFWISAPDKLVTSA